MIASRSAKEIFSQITGISVAVEDDISYQRKVEEAKGYFIRRHTMAAEAAEEFPRAGTFRFYEDSKRELDSFRPDSIKRRRWLIISGFKIPLPPVNVDR